MFTSVGFNILKILRSPRVTSPSASINVFPCSWVMFSANFFYNSNQTMFQITITNLILKIKCTMLVLIIS